MLYNYRTDDDYMSALTANQPGLIAEWARLRKRKGRTHRPINTTRSQVAPQRTTPRDHHNRPADKMKYQPGLKARIRSAVKRMFGGYNHCMISTITRRVMKAANHMRLDVDHPNTHVAFSPDGVKAYDMKRRRSLTFAKFLSRKCKHIFTKRLKINDAVAEVGQAAFQIHMEFSRPLKIVSGQEAFAAYSSDKGIDSCMSLHPTKYRYIEHHLLSNPDKVKLIVAYNERGYLLLRAKLWCNEDGTHHLDRLYWRSEVGASSERQLHESIYAWLTQQGYNLSPKIDCVLHHEVGAFMPYMDRHAQRFDRLDRNTIHIREGGKHCAVHANGHDESAKGGVCRNCQCWIGNNPNVEVRGAVYCMACSTALGFVEDRLLGGWCHPDDVVNVRYVDRNGNEQSMPASRHGAYVLYDGSFGRPSDCVNAVDYGYALRSDVVMTHYDHLYYLKTDTRVVPVGDGRYELKTRCRKLYDGTWGVRRYTRKLVDGKWAYYNDPLLVQLPEEQFALQHQVRVLPNGEYELAVIVPAANQMVLPVKE